MTDQRWLRFEFRKRSGTFGRPYILLSSQHPFLVVACILTKKAGFLTLESTSHAAFPVCVFTSDHILACDSSITAAGPFGIFTQFPFTLSKGRHLFGGLIVPSDLFHCIAFLFSCQSYNKDLGYLSKKLIKLSKKLRSEIVLFRVIQKGRNIDIKVIYYSFLVFFILVLIYITYVLYNSSFKLLLFLLDTISYLPLYNNITKRMQAILRLHPSLLL